MSLDEAIRQRELENAVINCARLWHRDMSNTDDESTDWEVSIERLSDAVETLERFWNPLRGTVAA